MVSLWWGQSALDELIEKATSEQHPAGYEDISLYLEISDQIRSKKVNAKDAMQSLKKRLDHKNPNVQLMTLSLVDTCVKNGGDPFVREIAGAEFMDGLAAMLKSPTAHQDVKTKILAIIQTWGEAAKGKPGLSYMVDSYSILKAQGFQFPPLKEANSLFLETSAAPEWTDSDVCERCRIPFTMTNRKHHCRHCGRTFCQQCSSKTMALPHMGINEEVRVCDGCHIKLRLAKATKQDALPPLPTTSESASRSSDRPTESRATQEADEFEEDLRKAIELSLKESEQQRHHYGAGYTPPVGNRQQTSTSPPKDETEEDDPDLAAAIAASLKEMSISSAPPSNQTNTWSAPTPRKDDLSPTDMENIEMFSTLIERIYARGGDVSNDAQINNLYTKIGALQPKMVRSLDEVNRKHHIFVSMHEKLNAAVKAYDRLLEQRIAGTYNRMADRSHLSYGGGGYHPSAVPHAPIATPSMEFAHIPQHNEYQQAYNTMPSTQPAIGNAAHVPPYSGQHTYSPSGTQEYQGYVASTAPPGQPQVQPVYDQSQERQSQYYYPQYPSYLPSHQQQPHHPQQTPQQSQPRVDDSPLIDLS